MADLCFATPGDPDSLTGGYLYNARMRAEVSAHGWSVEALRLPDTFPFPGPDDQAEALRLLVDAAARCDVMVIDGLAFGALPAETLMQIRCPLIALVHHPLADESGLARDQATRFYESESAALTYADGVIVTSPHTQKSLVQRYGVDARKIAVVVPGVAQPEMRGARPPDVPHILSVGTLTQRKGHDVLLAALGMIRDLDWTATIVGSDARDRDVTRRLTDQRIALGLADRVTFAGERRDLSDAYAQATVFALATRHEGYGMVFSEAMAHGLPIVSCRVGAVPETVPAEAGLLVPGDNPAKFAMALRKVLTNDVERARLATGAAAIGRALPTWRDAGRAFARKLTEVNST